MAGIGVGKKFIVGLAITPNIGLEAIVYDNSSHKIMKYGQKFLEYNIASKEIQDPSLLVSAIADLYAELDIPKDKSDAYLVVPNVQFGFTTINEGPLDNDSITATVESELGESYIFKQSPAVTAWVDVNEGSGTSKYIAYTGLQESALVSITDSFSDAGVNLVGIEGSTSAIPRGIALSGICDDVIHHNDNWNILLINSNNYVILQMSGKRLLDYVEIPFAVMSFEGDEIYSALSAAISQYLPNYPAKKLVLVSQTDNVSANILKNAIVYDEEVLAVDSNRFGNNPLLEISDEVIKQAASTMSMSVLGAAVPKWGHFATLNFIGDVSFDGNKSYGAINLGGKNLEITSKTIMIYSILLCILFAAIGGIGTGALFLTAQGFESVAKDKQTQIDAVQAEIDQLNKQLNGSITSLIKAVVDKNKQAINYYDSLSTDIPSDVWLTYYINKNGQEVGIEGLSVSINDVYSYYKSLKLLAPSSDIKLNKLDVFQENEESSGDMDQFLLNTDNSQQTFAFEISNTVYVKSFDEKGNKVQTSNEDMQKALQELQEAAKAVESGGGSAPGVPDVDPNLKEAN